MQTEKFVKNVLNEAEGGHDWWHIWRVRNLALKIASTVTSDTFIIELGSLLHDIADHKFHNGDETKGEKIAEEFLRELHVDENTIYHVKGIINNVSFKGGNETRSYSSTALDIIQDADRLDAIGAIGIARTFNYGGYKGRELYNPEVEANLNMTKEEYKKSTAPTLNHFYEKLLLLKDMMNTEEGKAIAQKRHGFMLEYLKEFYNEWNIEV